jgi:beta-glucosidase
MIRLRIFGFLLFICIVSITCKKDDTGKGNNAKIAKQVDELIAQMTLEEKVGQMTQGERGSLISIPSEIRDFYLGSVLSGGGSAPANNTFKGWADMLDTFQSYALKTRLKIPIIYGTDAVHGDNNVPGAVIFPHNIGMGCMRNPDLIEQAAQATAEEISATGVRWTFGPCVAVARNIRWGRTFESYSEVPELAAECGAAAIKGFQGNDLSDPYSVLACAKHYMGDGGTTNGTDQGNTEVDEATLRKIFLPVYTSAVKTGVGSIMASYNSWNGQKVHGNKYLITDILKGELGFKGFVVSDWNAISQVNRDFKTAIQMSINAGIDMAMQAGNHKQFISKLIELVNEGKVSMSRIDDAVRRILTIKFKMDVFNRPYADRSVLGSIDFDQHRELARNCVKRSIVLLKNENHALPLSKSLKKIVVSGSNINDLGAQCGGWTVSWSGQRGKITQGTTIYDAIKQSVSPSTEVIYSAKGTEAAGADFGIAVVGEDPYAEYIGDRKDLPLKASDVTAVNNIKNSGVPLILIIVSGRPMVLSNVIDNCDAIIAAWLPGTEGLGVSDVLFGDYAPTGKLSHTWPRSISQEPINYGDADYDPLFPYGFGLSY